MQLLLTWMLMKCFSLAAPPLRTLCWMTSERPERNIRGRSSPRNCLESNCELTTQRCWRRTSSWTCCFHTEIYRYRRNSRYSVYATCVTWSEREIICRSRDPQDYDAMVKLVQTLEMLPTCDLATQPMIQFHYAFALNRSTLF